MPAFVVALLVSALFSAPSASAATLPGGFTDTTVFSGLTNPTVVQFSPDGRVFVAEKSGLIKVFDNLSDTTPSIFADLRTQVHNYWDRGLLGMALAPSFPTNPYVYVLYSRDASIAGTAPRWGEADVTSDSCPNPPGPTTDGCVISGRLSRLQAAGDAMTGPEQVLIDDWCQQYPSHSVGSLVFGPDGSLYASAGDGAGFNFADYGQDGSPLNPCGDPPGGIGGVMTPPSAEGGALRSQDLRTLSKGGTMDYAGLVASLSPVAYWRLGETSGTTATDSAGSNTGTYAGGPTLNQPGLLTNDADRAVAFDGLNDQVTVPNAPALNPVNSMSIAAWVNADSWARNPRIIQKGRTDNQYQIMVEAGTLYFVMSGVGLISAPPPSPGARHLIVGTYDGISMRLYVDNVLVGTTVGDGPPSVSSDPLAIGNKAGSTHPLDPFAGVIDEVSIHNIGLSSAQVGQLWTAGTTGVAVGPGDPVTLDGTVIRIDPVTGAGVPSNPLSANPDPNARRVVAYGFRNPFRFTLRPGTNEVWLGDVGWNDWEEIDRLTNVPGTAQDFGWPCYEGDARQAGYDGLGLNLCENLYAAGAGGHASPYLTYNHGSTVVPAEACPVGSSSISGLAFYPSSGGTYPSSYADGLFFGDYSRHCIWFMPKGTNGLPDASQVQTFVSATSSPVYLTIGPGGDLFYVDFDGGTIRRVRYTLSNQAPTASIAANPTTGDAPLTVQFDGRGSSDPEGGALTYEWDLNGDGIFDDGTGPTASFTYDTPGSRTARLRVTDPGNVSDTASTVISVGLPNSPPVPVIDSPDALTWAVGDKISFSGHATDAEDGTLPAAALSWDLILYHCPSNCHTHPLSSWPGVATGSFTAPDHDYPSYLELRLTATDSSGASVTTTRRLDPRTVVMSFSTAPSGLTLTVGSTSAVAPFTRTVIVGSRNTISAPVSQVVGGQTYVFGQWSDGGARAHDVIAPATPVTYTASYVSGADVGLVLTGQQSPGTRIVTWGATITNNGPGSATGVVVSDVLPNRLTFTSGSGPGGACSYATSSRTVSCPVGDLSKGQSAHVTIVTTVEKRTLSISNTQKATATSPDSDLTNNSMTVVVRLR